MYAGYGLGLWQNKSKTNKQVNWNIHEFKKKRNDIKPGDANVDYDSLMHFIKHNVCIYETEKEQHKIKRYDLIRFQMHTQSICITETSISESLNSCKKKKWITKLYIADVKINKNARFEEDATMKNKHKTWEKKWILIPLK